MYSYRFAVQHSSKLFEVSSMCLDTFSGSCDQRTCNLTKPSSAVDHKFPSRWIGRGSAESWPPRSPDLNPLDYHVWGYMKAMVYAHKLNTREELLQRILSAARSKNNAAVLRKITGSLVTRVRKCVQADGGHFE